MASEQENNDNKLIDQLRNPDKCRSAFKTLIRQYSEPLYRQIRRLVQSHDDTNDLLQNTFLKAWQSLEYFRGEARLSTWLYKIAVNEALSFLARERKRRNISIDDQEAALANHLESDPYLDGDRAQALLQKAILTLPEKQRIIFNMRYFDEMKYDQISEILGTTEGALKASYHIAAKKIEKYLQENQ